MAKKMKTISELPTGRVGTCIKCGGKSSVEDIDGGLKLVCRSCGHVHCFYSGDPQVLGSMWSNSTEF